MNMDDIKSNKFFLIITMVILGIYTFMSFSGKGYWQSSGVTRNAGYSGPIPHSGYGVRFYHK